MPLNALEAAGQNIIPVALGERVADRLGLPIDLNIVQVNKVGHTGSSGYKRLALPALFDGPVQRGQDYILVDDFIGQGGTLANLRGYIESEGGRVVLGTVLTGKPYSAKLSLDGATLEKLREKHGQVLDHWWRGQFGYGLDGLTESEARYLERSDSFDKIRDRILEERGKVGL